MIRVRDCVHRAHPGREFAVLIISVLSGKDALELGSAVRADDYLCKPFTFVEIAARVSMMLRVIELTRAQNLRVGTYLSSLPPAVSDRLKRGQGAAERVDSVSILVVRIVGLEAAAGLATPAALAQALSTVAEVFDGLVRKYGAFRIDSTGASRPQGHTESHSKYRIGRELKHRRSLSPASIPPRPQANC